MENYKVYMLTSPEGKCYIGTTKLTLPQRCRRGNGYKHCNPRMAEAIQKYEWDLWKTEIIADHLTKGEAFSMEHDLIIRHKTQDPKFGYNSADGGEFPRGWHLSEEQIKVMSERNRGRHLTDATRKKIGDASRGRVFTEEHKRKIGDAQRGEKNHMYGKKQSDSTIEKRRKWNLEHPQGTNKRIRQIDLSGSLVCEWGSMSEAARVLGIRRTDITACCAGKQKTAHGFKWEYAKQETSR